MSIKVQALSYLRTMVADPQPSLRLAFWDGDLFDFSSQPEVVIRITSPRVLGALMQGDFEKLGDAYVNGSLAVEGRPRDIINVGVCLCEKLEKSRAAGLMKFMTRFASRRMSMAQEAANVRRHYDVSNEFYKLWLDKRLVYSCAYYQNDDDDIDLAQEQKLSHLCRKLMLKPGEKLLDVGCGWGALLQWATERHGTIGTGITLSERQFEEAKIRLAHLDGKVDLAIKNFKELEECSLFDKVVSVGMYEHVGAAALPTYFSKMAMLLKPGGVFLNHGIVSTGGQPGPSGGEFIERYVFPGGSVSTLSTLAREISSAGLEILDIEDLRPHYVRTLLDWSERLEQHKESAIAAAGPEVYRIWRVYLPGMAYAFERGWLSVAQILALKPKDGRPAPRPWTRAYQYLY
ncbi:MAG: methyltransferase domain-containing protein [Hyphomicrobiales bacterium]|nr:MAG: methyltransferase domain-containing protein [Hyphomicrobiales bacterium]